MSLRGRHLYPRNYPRNRRYTNIARDVWTAWIRRVGSLDKNIPSENVPSLLSEMHLYPAQTQVGEMLECAKELAERGSHLTYGEFYNFASQIKRSHERRNNKQIGRAYERNGHEKKKRPRKMSKCNVTHDVFLGGSCNPTTWRQDVAIPLLESLGITYYNPQVSEWSADLVTVEHNAKESACILFYVLDRRTRNVVGIVEAANFAGAHRNLVLVMDSYREQEPIAGETITHTEFEELCSGLATLKDLVERQGIPVFTSITTAIHWTAELLNQKPKVIGTINALQKVNLPDNEKRKKLREIFELLDKNGEGEINLADVYLAYHLVTNKKTLKDLQNVKRNHELEKELSSDCNKINFEQFCVMMKDLKQQNGATESEHPFSPFYSIFRPICSFLGHISCCKPELTANHEYVHPSCFDLYIGGSCFDLEWKGTIAEPILKKSGLKYIMAECGLLKNSKAAPKEADIMENSSLLLFIITSNSRGLETMAIASFYIGRGKNVVICIQELNDSCCISNEKFSQLAMNDYNRGRIYLKDLACRKGVPVLESISDAVQYAVDRCIALPHTSTR
ncbi:NDT-like domain-containing protein raw isoform X4 [Rhodnius prolixus]|uniref:NDT-like domain-containing protein raw isoform X4 n=1 Tax=Rhodnius prolixus TaxID=13249 RepID=UPI003D18D1F8